MAEPPDDRALEAAILDLLGRRSPDASICPSEVARVVGGATWRPLMDPVRAAAGRLVDAGRLAATQGSEPVDPRTARGPIRLRRP